MSINDTNLSTEERIKRILIKKVYRKRQKEKRQQRYKELLRQGAFPNRKEQIMKELKLFQRIESNLLKNIIYWMNENREKPKVWEVIETLVNVLEINSTSIDPQESQPNVSNKNRKDQDLGYVYLLQGNDWYKIGKSVKPQKRSYRISTKMPFKCELLLTIKTQNKSKLELKLHQTFADKRMNGEWFDLNESDLDKIRKVKRQTENQVDTAQHSVGGVGDRVA